MSFILLLVGENVLGIMRLFMLVMNVLFRFMGMFVRVINILFIELFLVVWVVNVLMIVFLFGDVVLVSSILKGMGKLFMGVNVMVM